MKCSCTKKKQTNKTYALLKVGRERGAERDRARKVRLQHGEDAGETRDNAGDRRLHALRLLARGEEDVRLARNQLGRRRRGSRCRCLLATAAAALGRLLNVGRILGQLGGDGLRN